MMLRRVSRHGRGGSGGRILAHNRDTDEAPTVAGAGISAEHQAAIFTTSTQGLNKKTRMFIVALVRFVYP